MSRRWSSLPSKKQLDKILLQHQLSVIVKLRNSKVAQETHQREYLLGVLYVLIQLFPDFPTDIIHKWKPGSLRSHHWRDPLTSTDGEGNLRLMKTVKWELEEVQEWEQYHSGREGRALLRNPRRQILTSVYGAPPCKKSDWTCGFLCRIISQMLGEKHVFKTLSCFWWLPPVLLHW